MKTVTPAYPARAQAGRISTRQTDRVQRVDLAVPAPDAVVRQERRVVEERRSGPRRSRAPGRGPRRAAGSRRPSGSEARRPAARLGRASAPPRRRERGTREAGRALGGSGAPSPRPRWQRPRAREREGAARRERARRPAAPRPGGARRGAGGRRTPRAIPFDGSRAPATAATTTSAANGAKPGTPCHAPRGGPRRRPRPAPPGSRSRRRRARRKWFLAGPSGTVAILICANAQVHPRLASPGVAPMTRREDRTPALAIALEGLAGGEARYGACFTTWRSAE